jgi:hypothetical protein
LGKVSTISRSISGIERRGIDRFEIGDGLVAAFLQVGKAGFFAMPELPEVETTVRGLARYLDGARIARVGEPPGPAPPFPPDLVQVLTGATVTGLGGGPSTA